MPQDSVSKVNTTAGYKMDTADSDSLNQAILHLRHVLKKEQEFQKKAAEYSSWAPLITIILLVLIWIIIKLKHGKKEDPI